MSHTFNVWVFLNFDFRFAESMATANELTNLEK